MLCFIDFHKKNPPFSGISLKAVRILDDKPVGVAINCRNTPWQAKIYSNYATNSNDINVQQLFTLWSIIAHEPKIHESLKHNNVFEVFFSHLHYNNTLKSNMNLFPIDCRHWYFKRIQWIGSRKFTL